MQVSVLSILGIYEVEQRIKTQFIMNMSWYDFRLELYNMKTNPNLNTLTNEEKNSIWIPVLLFRKFIKNRLEFNLSLIYFK